MTFSKLTCKPGSRLNLVIGPNGSGKSSLVCAIALGLGGEPQVRRSWRNQKIITCEFQGWTFTNWDANCVKLQLLGRASSIGAFVKRGEESGYIKISLRGETKEDQLTILRKIDTRNKSEWIFNGKKSLFITNASIYWLFNSIFVRTWMIQVLQICFTVFTT